MGKIIFISLLSIFAATISHAKLKSEVEKCHDNAHGNGAHLDCDSAETERVLNLLIKAKNKANSVLAASDAYDGRPKNLSDQGFNNLLNYATELCQVVATSEAPGWRWSAHMDYCLQDQYKKQIQLFEEIAKPGSN